MKYIALFSVISSVGAFTANLPRHCSSTALKSLDGAHSEMETFERAVYCAEHFGTCPIEQMELLAKELEDLNGSYFESSNEEVVKNNKPMIKKEIEDRQDVADVLKKQGELRLRMDYLKNANLFTYQVHSMDDAYPEGN